MIMYVAASPGAQQTFPTIEEKLDADGRSVYVGNVSLFSV